MNISLKYISFLFFFLTEEKLCFASLFFEFVIFSFCRESQDLQGPQGCQGNL